MVWYRHPIFVCIVACIIPNLGGFLGSLITNTSDDSWYGGLFKPKYNPPNWIFFPAWTTLYILIGFASFRVWYKEKGLTKRAKIALAVYAVQLILNWLWTPIFFGFEALGWALIEILIMWVVIFITTVMFFQIDTVAGICMVPYIGWITFASILNYSLWDLNTA